MYRNSYILLRIAVLFSALLIQENTWSNSNFFRRIDSSNGLPHNTVFSIMQDMEGFMWFGTRLGLSRYDGANFVTFNSSNSNISNNVIRDIVQVNDSIFYIATEEGLISFNHYSRIMVPLMFDKINFKPAILDLEIDSDNAIWMATSGDGVYRIYDGKLEHYPLPDFSEEILCINGRVYIVASAPGMQGIYMLSKNRKEFERISKINAMTINSLGSSLWIGTQGDGLVEMSTKGDIISQYKLGAEHNKNIIRDIISYKDGLLISTEGGLFMFDKERGVYSHDSYNSKDQYSIADNALYSLCLDKEGGIWVGSYFRGVSYLPPISNLFTTSHLKHLNNQYSGDAISSFLELDTDNIIVASEDNGLCFYNPIKKAFSEFEFSGSLSYNNIHDVCRDNLGRIWIGTYLYGINIYDPNKKTFDHLGIDNFNIHSNSVYRIYLDSKNHIHIGTTMGASTYYPDGTVEKHEITRFGIIRDIHEDNMGNIWYVSMNRGIFKYTPSTKKWEEYSKENGKIPTNKCVCIRSDDANNVWIGTESFGLLLYKRDGSFDIIDKKKGLEDNFIFSIECVDNNIWIGTTRGLCRYTPLTKECKTYTNQNGLPSIYFNYNASRKMKSGELYFGTVNGFIRFKPSDEQYNTYVPNGKITSINVSGRTKNILLSETRNDFLNDKDAILSLKYFQNNISISIASLSFVNPIKNRCKYILEGYDTQWQEEANIEKIEYNNLSPGKYRFVAYVSNNDEVWSKDPIIKHIVIYEPFWENNIAKSIYSLLVVLLLFVLIKYIKRRDEKKHLREIEEYEKKTNESKINFFTNITHEIKTPLSLIKAPIEILMDDKSFPEHLRPSLMIMDKNTQWLEELVAELLEFRQLEENKYSINIVRVDLVELLQVLYQNFHFYSKTYGVRFDFYCKLDSLLVDIDPKAIIKVVSNLLTNAFKYAKDHIVICMRYRPRTNAVTISVYDNGSGIAEEDKAKIFEPFTQIDRKDGKFKGVGIGLSLSKYLVGLHGGNISLSSYLGRWCCFHVNIPVVSMNESPHIDLISIANLDFSRSTSSLDVNLTQHVSISKSPVDRNERSKALVLIVEDTPDLAQIIVDHFSAKYNVAYAPNGLEAIDYIRKYQPDIVISDIIMPEMDGIELLKAIRSDYNISHTAIVLLTAKTTDEDKLIGLEMGANAYIKKPFVMKEVDLVVRNLLDMREQLRHRLINGQLNIEKEIPITQEQLFFNQLSELINRNIDNENLKIDDIASELNISRSLFYLKLKKIVNMSPNEYIQSIRLNRAKELLRETNFTVSEISYKVGFSDPNYFSRSFKLFFDETPSAFRDRIH